jgi:hypothetical protein
MKEATSGDNRIHNCDSMGPQLQADIDYIGNSKKQTQKDNPCFKSYFNEKGVTDVICRGKRLQMTEFKYQTNLDTEDHSLSALT